MIIYSLLRATKEGATGRTVLVMMSVGLTEALHGPPFTPDLTARQQSYNQMESSAFRRTLWLCLWLNPPLRRCYRRAGYRGVFKQAPPPIKP